MCAVRRSWLPIVEYPLNGGAACPPLSALQQAEACVPSNSSCGQCDNGSVNSSVPATACGVWTECRLCGAGFPCATTADCQSGLECGGAGVCMGTVWV